MLYSFEFNLKIGFKSRLSIDMEIKKIKFDDHQLFWVLQFVRLHIIAQVPAI